MMTEPASLSTHFQPHPTGLGAFLSSLASAVRHAVASAFAAKEDPSQLAPEESANLISARAKRMMRSGD